MESIHTVVHARLFPLIYYSETDARYIKDMRTFTVSYKNIGTSISSPNLDHKAVATHLILDSQRCNNLTNDISLGFEILSRKTVPNDELSHIIRYRSIAKCARLFFDDVKIYIMAHCIMRELEISPRIITNLPILQLIHSLKLEISNIMINGTIIYIVMIEEISILK